MLLPVSVGPGGLTRLSDLSLDGNESIGGRLCFRIHGRAPVLDGTAVWRTTLWIDRNEYLLRRIDERFSEFYLTTSYEPSLAPIDLNNIIKPDISDGPTLREPIPWTGIRLSPNSGLIKAIDRNSPAAYSGLETGDEIEGINDQRIGGLEAVRSLLMRERPVERTRDCRCA